MMTGIDDKLYNRPSFYRRKILMTNILKLLFLIHVIAIFIFISPSNLSLAEAESTIEEGQLDTGEGGGEQENIGVEEHNNGQERAEIFNAIENDGAVKWQEFNTAKLIALNKITAKSKELILKIGEAKYFGNIEIKVHKCLKSLDLYLPDNKILFTVIENKIDEDPLLVFQGWMMSSNISVSSFEHPIYEIFARDCL